MLKGRVKSLNKRKWEKLTSLEELKLIKKGFLFVRWRGDSSSTGVLQNRTLNLINSKVPPSLTVGGPANFILAKRKKPLYVVLNGFLIDLAADAVHADMNTIGY